MKIINSCCNTSLKDLKYGDTFVKDGKLFMLCNEDIYGKMGIEEKEEYVVDLLTGTLYSPIDVIGSEPIMKVNCEVKWSV